MIRHLTNLDMDIIAVMASIGLVTFFVGLLFGGWIPFAAWVFVLSVLTVFAVIRLLLGRIWRDDDSR